MADLTILATDHADFLALYTGDNISGSELVNEGAGGNAVMVGTTQVAGLIGSARQLNGTSDYIYTDEGATGDCTYSLWFRCGTPSANSLLLSQQKQGETAIRYRGAYMDSAGYLYGITRTSTGAFASTSPIGGYDDNEYHNLVFSQYGATLYIYIDKVMVGSVTVDSAVSWESRVEFGRRVVADDQYFNVQLDHIRAYNAAHISAGKLEAFYEETLPYEIKGTVIQDGSPLTTKVRLYNAATGALIDSLVTDSNGDYQKILETDDQVYVMAVPNSGYRPLVHGPINPSLRYP